MAVKDRSLSQLTLAPPVPSWASCELPSTATTLALRCMGEGLGGMTQSDNKEDAFWVELSKTEKGEGGRVWRGFVCMKAAGMP